MSSFTATRRVEFRDTDAAGIMHFASFFPLMESVEHEFLRSLGLSVMAKDDSGPFSWPRVNAQCDFQGAVRFEDVLTVTLTISRLGTKSVTYQFDVRHDNRPRGDRHHNRRLLPDTEGGHGTEIDAHSGGDRRQAATVLRVIWLP